MTTKRGTISRNHGFIDGCCCAIFINKRDTDCIKREMVEFDDRQQADFWAKKIMRTAKKASAATLIHPVFF